MKKNYLNKLKPYQPNQIEADIILSANESQNYLFNDGYIFNKDASRYPEANADSLRQSLSDLWALNQDNFIVGNGSTELLELVVKTYVNQNEIILSFSPSFSMYSVYASIYNAKMMTIPIDDNGSMNMIKLIEKAKTVQPKLIFLCNPNNPTGSVVKRNDIISLLNQTEALVVVDEAYMDFAFDEETMIRDVNHYKNMIVSRTFSKAYGLAAFRLGYVVSNPRIINDLLSVKLPYNVNQSSIEIGKIALKEKIKVKRFIQNINMIKDSFISKLKDFPIKVYPSKGNFVYIKTNIDLYQVLLKKNILIRSFGNDCYRITIGTIDQMDVVYKVLKEYYSENINPS